MTLCGDLNGRNVGWEGRRPEESGEGKEWYVGVGGNEGDGKLGGC